MSEWGKPALFFMRGSRSPSPPPLPTEHPSSSSFPSFPASMPPLSMPSFAALPSPYSTLSSSSHLYSSILSPSPSPSPSSSPCPSPPCASSSRLSPPLRHPIAIRPLTPPSSLSSLDGGKKAKRKASGSHAIDHTALRHVHLSTSPILLPLLDGTSSSSSSSASLLACTAAFCSFLPLPPTALSIPAMTSGLLWSCPPPFLCSMLVRFFDGRTLAACLHINSSYRRDLLPTHLAAPFCAADDTAVPFSSSHLPSAVGMLCVDQENYNAVADASSFSSLSSSPTLLLRSLYTTNLAHQLHTLKLSTVRLTKQTCRLLSSLLFLRTLELRLFEHLADEWKTDFLSSAAAPSYGSDLFFLPSSSTLSTHSACSVNDLPAITASAAALRAALRRLPNLQHVSVVGFVDVQDSDDLPVTSAHSSAILDAMADLRIKRLELRDGHFGRTYGYEGVLTERRIRAMPELESVHIVDAVRWGEAQLQVLLASPQLVAVRLTGDICLSPTQMQAMSAAWPAATSLRIDPVVIDDAKISACNQVDEAEALLTRCCLRPTADTAQPYDNTGVCVTAFFAPLLSFSHLTSLHLTFTSASLAVPYLCSPRSPSVRGREHSAAALLSPSSSSSSSSFSFCLPEQQPVSFCVDSTLWESLWLPSSPLVRHLRHLTLPVLCGARMSAVLSCSHLSSLRLVGPLPVDGEMMAALQVGLAAACSSLRELSLPCFVSQLPAVNEWLDAVGTARAVWPLLHRVHIVEAGVAEESVVVLLDRRCR